MASTLATQHFVPIDHIRDGVAVLKSGELRSVIITSSLNLSLKSEEEQQAVLMQFQNLLNTLDFPIEFFVQSRRLNIKPYIDLLQTRSSEVKEDLLKIQIHEYIGFIKKFTDETNIMTKHFFIVVPYLPQTQGLSSGSSMPFGFGNKEVSENNSSFDISRIQLEQRVSTIVQSLSRFGLRGQKLNTEELVELFYKLFNPGEQDRQAPHLTQQ